MLDTPYVDESVIGQRRPAPRERPRRGTAPRDGRRPAASAAVEGAVPGASPSEDQRDAPQVEEQR
eukprot:7569856-Lingulodinium_polyedra.AAC.1